MFDILREVWFYILIPPLAILIGGLVGTVYTPRPFVESAIQHFAAGMIFAAVAGELIPQLVETGRAWVIVGFTFGTLTMFGSKLITERYMGVRVGHSHGDAAPGVASLIVASAVNFIRTSPRRRPPLRRGRKGAARQKQSRLFCRCRAPVASFLL